MTPAQHDLCTAGTFLVVWIGASALGSGAVCAMIQVALSEVGVLIAWLFFCGVLPDKMPEASAPPGLRVSRSGVFAGQWFFLWPQAVGAAIVVGIALLIAASNGLTGIVSTLSFFWLMYGKWLTADQIDLITPLKRAGARSNAPSSVANVAILLLPSIVIYGVAMAIAIPIGLHLPMGIDDTIRSEVAIEVKTWSASSNLTTGDPASAMAFGVLYWTVQATIKSWLAVFKRSQEAAAPT